MITRTSRKIIRLCDKCGKVSDIKGKILRCSFYVNTPFYDYFGFDLCKDCLKEFEENLKGFLSSLFDKDKIEMKEV